MIYSVYYIIYQVNEISSYDKDETPTEYRKYLAMDEKELEKYKDYFYGFINNALGGIDIRRAPDNETLTKDLIEKIKRETFISDNKLKKVNYALMNLINLSECAEQGNVKNNQ